MYLKLAQELVELKTEYEETVKNIQLFQEVGKTIELRNRIEQLAEQILTKQKYFNSLLNPKKYV